jgi:adenylosuccinate synthase
MRILVDKETGEEFEYTPTDREDIYWAVIKPVKRMISCYNQETKELEHFEVDKNVYTYIKQLEHYVKYPKTSKLIQLYSFRFEEK